eukprot:g1352.t1
MAAKGGAAAPGSSGPVAHDTLIDALEAQLPAKGEGEGEGAPAPAAPPALCANSGLRMGIEFDNLTVTVADGKGGQKQILSDVSGRLSPGSFLALMGPTGSGKTTLIHTLLHRRGHDGGIGRVAYSTTGHRGGETRTCAWSKDIKRQLAFVSQDDIVIEGLTVRQSLSYTAQLRLPRAWSAARRAAQVALVMDTLRIAKCGDTRIADVSGGERKRLCIAQELLSQPAVVAMDEPTSGLDSAMALTVVRALKDIARAGMTVLTSIHQPSSQIFAEFDHLTLLNHGAVRYAGPAGAVVPYLGRLGLACPPHFNPADWAMDLLVTGALERDGVLEVLRRDFGGGAAAAAGTADENTSTDTGAGKQQLAAAEPFEPFEHEHRYNLTWREQLAVLTARTRALQRSELFTLDNAALYLGLAFIAGVIWFRLQYAERNVFHRVSLSLWLIGTWTFFPMFNSMPVFPAFMDVLRHEVRAGQYRLSAFYVARTLRTLPLELVFPSLYIAIVWWMGDLNPSAASFARGYLAILLNLVTMQSVGLCISAGVPESKMVTCAILVITFFFGSSGLFVESTRLPAWFAWTRHVNLLRYGYNLLMHQVFLPEGGGGSMAFSCATHSAYELCRAGAGAGAGAGGAAPAIRSADVLAHNDVRVPASVCIAVMASAAVALHAVAYHCLRHRVAKAD